MDRLQVEQFLKLLNAKNVTPTSQNWVSASCPLAPFLHKSGKDSKPSFGIRVEPKDRSHYNCFTCSSGSLSKLVQTLAYHLSFPQHEYLRDQFDLVTAVKMLEDSDVVILGEYEDEEPALSAIPWGEDALEEKGLRKWHEVPRAREYLAGRNVPDSVADHFDLRFDVAKLMLVTPFRNAYGQLCGARGRTVDPLCPREFRHHDYSHHGINNIHRVWLNEQCLNTGGAVIVVEGQFDLFRVFETYQNVVGNLTSKASVSKMEKLLHAEGVLEMMDNDQPGRDAAKRLEDFYRSHRHPFGSVEYDPAFGDPDSIPREIMGDILADLL